jgi:CheY-like chemotaxis protein
MKKINSILLIEDDPISNFLSDTIIRKLNFAEEINIKGNGESALKFLEESHLNNKEFPQIIILDINMPIMDGFEFLEKLELLPYYNKKKTLIIILSNLLSEKDIKILNQITSLTYLSKPLNKEKLMGLLLKENKPELEYNK